MSGGGYVKGVGNVQGMGMSRGVALSGGGYLRGGYALPPIHGSWDTIDNRAIHILLECFLVKVCTYE